MPGHSPVRDTSMLFDTIEDFWEPPPNSSLTDVMNKLFEGIIGDTGVYGHMNVGGYTCDWRGNGRFGGTSVQFGNDIFYARIAPKGVAGQRIAVGEERVIKILVMDDSSPSLRGKLTTFVFRRYENAKDAEVKMSKRCDEQTGTASCYGVAATIIHLPEHQGMSVHVDDRWSAGKEDYHAVYPSYEMICAADRSSRVTSSCAIYSIAASLSGLVEWGDVPNRPMITFSCEATHRASTVSHTTTLSQKLNADKKCDFPNQRAAQRIVAALRVSEDNSFKGFLQMLANPIHQGAVPDEMIKPDGLPLLMVSSIAIATYPERFGIRGTDLGTSNDAYAVGKIRELFRDCTDMVCNDGRIIYYSIDYLVDVALSIIQADIKAVESAPLAKAIKERRIEQIRIRQNETIRALYRMGVGLVGEVFSPIDPNTYKDLYNDAGFANGLYDPVAHADVNRCYDSGLHNTYSCHRDHNPMYHELMLARLLELMLEMDTFLWVGRWRGVQIVDSNPSTTTGFQCRGSAEQEADGSTAKPTDQTTTAEESRGDVTKKGNKKKMKKPKWPKASAEAGSDNIAARIPQECKLNRRAIESQARFLSKAFQVGLADAFSALDFTVFTVSTTPSCKCATCDSDITCVEAMSLSTFHSKCDICHKRRCLKCVSRIIDAGPNVPAPTCLECMKIDGVKQLDEQFKRVFGLSDDMLPGRAILED